MGVIYELSYICKSTLQFCFFLPLFPAEVTGKTGSLKFQPAAAVNTQIVLVVFRDRSTQFYNLYARYSSSIHFFSLSKCGIC